MDEGHSRLLERKRVAMERMNHLMRNMSPEQVERAVNLVEDRDDLMDMHEDYA